MHNFAIYLYSDVGELTKAESLLARTQEASRRINGGADPRTLTAAKHLADLYRLAMKPERSVPLYEDVLKRTRDESGPEHPDTLLAMADLGAACREAGRVPEGTDWLEQAWAKALKQT